MKKIILVYLTILLSDICLMAQTLPKFSSEGNETWYYLQFKRGSAVVQDMGEGSVLMTANAVKGKPTQLWKITGTENNCEIISRNGRHIYYNYNNWNNSGRFAASVAKTGSLKLYSTTTTYAPAWELQSNSISGYSMNQWSGYGSGRELGAWTSNDLNNPFDFVSVKDITPTDTVPKTRTEYKYVSSTTYVPSQAMTLWYTVPVTAQTCSNTWMDYALPIGNGQFGAMIYGGINQDIVQFNEKTLWTGSSTERGAYQNFGNLYMEDLGNVFSTSSSTYAAKNYYRELDLSTATASSSWTSPDGKTTYTRQYIASNPDQCVAIHIKASTSGAINTHFFLYNPHGNMARYSEGEGVFSGKLTTLSYNARIKVVPTGGEMTTDSTGIYVKDADEIMIILAGGTD
jgi:alpha-L-fucosidase 2